MLYLSARSHIKLKIFQSSSAVKAYVLFLYISPKDIKALKVCRKSNIILSFFVNKSKMDGYFVRKMYIYTELVLN